MSSLNLEQKAILKYFLHGNKISIHYKKGLLYRLVDKQVTRVQKILCREKNSQLR